MRAYVDKYWCETCPLSGLVYCFAENMRLIRIKNYEFRTIPVSFELGAKFFQNVRQILGGYLQIPFESAGHCSVGHICRPDIGRGKAGFALKMISFGMQTRTSRVIGNTD